MFIYNDKFFRGADGKLYTGEYIEHFGANAEKYLGKLTELSDEEKYNLPDGVVINCNYKQFFTVDDNRILCNNIADSDLELVSGSEYDEENDTYAEIFQYFIIDDNLANYLTHHSNEIIYYHSRLDIHVLGVTHLGTSWDYVAAEYIV